jgi:hypothetical protein
VQFSVLLIGREEAATSSVRLLVAAAILSSTWLLAQDHLPNPS